MYRNQRPPVLHRRADLASIRTVRSHATATVSVKYETKLGESLKLVGSNSNWDPNVPQSEMTWSSGHVWSRTIEADASTTVEFKLVVVGNKGQAQWENGDNRVITIPSSPLPSPILVNCLFGNTKEMKVVVPEIPPQISAIKAAASVKAEEVVTGVKQQQELGSGKVDKAKNVEANPSASIGETPGPSSPVSKEAQAASGEVATDAVQVEGAANQGFPVGVVFAVVTLGAAALYLKFNPLANLTDASNLASSFMVAARDKVTSGI